MDILAGTPDNHRSNCEPWPSLLKLHIIQVRHCVQYFGQGLIVRTCITSPYISCDTRYCHVASFRDLRLASSADSLKDVDPTCPHNLLSNSRSTNIAEEACRQGKLDM